MSPSCCNGIVHLNPYGADAVLLAVNLTLNPATTEAYEPKMNVTPNAIATKD